MDGGIYSGQNALKALALGAKGVYLGRAFLYGLGALGEAGVTKSLEIIRKELDLTMAFCGVTDVRKVDKNVLVPGTYEALTHQAGVFSSKDNRVPARR
jgi:L-lactate dehydrogenase (cytochrome)